MKELIQKLKEQLIEALNLEEITPDDIDAEAPLFGDGLGLDSIDALEIILILEKNSTDTDESGRLLSGGRTDTTGKDVG
mgnify:CR=1 FL=1